MTTGEEYKTGELGTEELWTDELDTWELWIGDGTVELDTGELWIGDGIALFVSSTGTKKLKSEKISRMSSHGRKKNDCFIWINSFIK